jgi:NAD(P)H-dependent FMN reductase
MTRQSVLDELNERLKVYSIKILGNKKDKADGFYILMNTQAVCSNRKNVYSGITKTTLDLLDRAEIKYKVLE